MTIALLNIRLQIEAANEGYMDYLVDANEVGKMLVAFIKQEKGWTLSYKLGDYDEGTCKITLVSIQQDAFAPCCERGIKEFESKILTPLFDGTYLYTEIKLTGSFVRGCKNHPPLAGSGGLTF